MACGRDSVHRRRVVDQPLESLLKQALAQSELGEPLATRAAAAAGALVSWMAKVEQWNRKMSLTAARSREELVDLMVADALMLSLHIAPASSVVDVGSGAGAPGLPLAMVRDDLAVTMIEPMQKRAALLRMVLAEQRLVSSTQLLQTRGEHVEESFDVAVSRATLPPPRWLGLGARLAPSGEVWVLLAREPAPELSGWKIVATHDYRWPLTAAERRAICYRRE
jgi:16S rRNA (guanine527-N7)-methyltransferase